MRDIQPVTVTVFNDWLRQSLNPLYEGKQETFKSVRVGFIIDDSDDNTAQNDLSGISKALEKCTLKFEDLDFYYDCMSSNPPTIEKKQIGKYEIDAELKAAYAYLPAVTVSLSGASELINVSGNLPTSAIVTIIPAADLISVTLSGMGKEITINNLHVNTPIVIDGEQCLVTENGANKFSDTDMWAFPVLQPGSNTVSVDNSDVTVQVSYKPKFM
jgi:phage-related protein